MQNGKAAFRSTEKANRIRIRACRTDDVLTVLQSVNGTHTVSQFGGALKAQLLRRQKHFLFKLRVKLCGFAV